MLRIGIFIILSLLSFGTYSQLVPVENDLDLLKSKSVKRISTQYSSNEGEEAELIFQKEYDASGKVLTKYQLSLWDAVSYSHTTTYSYNEQGLLADETTIQKILNLSKRDEEFIETFGDKPLHEKVYYYYNPDGKLSKKAIFTYSGKEPEEDATPDQTIEYSYTGDLIDREESKSSDERFFNKDYYIEFKYDSANNLIQKSMAYGKDDELQRDTFYKYNQLGQLVEEQVIDPSIPHNNKHLKYEYDENGNRSALLTFNNEEGVFELETSFRYDDHGNLVSGDREVTFEYDQNGLIKTESWIDPLTDQEYTFTNTYLFH